MAQTGHICRIESLRARISISGGRALNAANRNGMSETRYRPPPNPQSIRAVIHLNTVLPRLTILVKGNPYRSAQQDVRLNSRLPPHGRSQTAGWPRLQQLHFSAITTYCALKVLWRGHENAEVVYGRQYFPNANKGLDGHGNLLSLRHYKTVVILLHSLS